MFLEEQRLIHEDLERLEEAIAEQLLEDPKHVGINFDTSSPPSELTY
jgi:hypothetical protein